MKKLLKTCLKAYLQLLERRNRSYPDFPLIDKASGYVRKLETLISELLDVSKIKADKVIYNLEKVSFERVLRDSIEGVQLFTETHQIVIEHCDDVTCFVDIGRLDQVIHNLLTNAIKYSPSADTIVVNSRIEHDQLITSIRDFGIGIAAENQKDLFTRFYRVDQPDMKFQGLGIGLYISKEIIERHHGKIRVESEPGKGSVFIFSLPVHHL